MIGRLGLCLLLVAAGVAGAVSALEPNAACASGAADYIVVDDFEDYNDYWPDRIFETWLDGWWYALPPLPCGDPPGGTGALIGHLTAPFAEQTIVHGGCQSMPFECNNDRLPYYSETEALLVEGDCCWQKLEVSSDWTVQGVTVLSLWFHGDPNNDPEQLYVGLRSADCGVAFVFHDDPNAVRIAEWQEWNIDLQDFNDAGVDLTDTMTIYMGFGDRNDPYAGGRGIVYFDDIRLYRHRCVASAVEPADGAEYVADDIVLRWKPTCDAVSHDVYLGTDRDAVVEAGTSTVDIYRGRQDINSYDPGPLDLEQTYYWRIDEVNDGGIRRGDVWSFTTGNYIVVDDFEDYNDQTNRIFWTWRNGLTYGEPPPFRVGSNGTGSKIGHLTAPFVEQTIVHGGRQSMPFYYRNRRYPYSETDALTSGAEHSSPKLKVGPDWTTQGVQALSLWFHGDPNNDPEQLYVGVRDANNSIEVVSHGDANVTTLDEWQEWNIDLQDFNDGGVNLVAVDVIYIGFGDRDDPYPGGEGIVYFDDIRLYRPRCVPSVLKPRADFNGDCLVGYADVEVLAGDWLGAGGYLAADLDGDADVDFADFGVLAGAWLDELLWPLP